MSRGYALYVDVLAALKRRPRTAALLHRGIGKPIELPKLRRVLRQLLDAEVLRVIGWRSGHQHRSRVYGIADGQPNVPHPGGLVDKPMQPMEQVTKFAEIWRELLDPTSALEVVEACGSSINRTRAALRRMVDAGLVGVSYRIEGSQRTRVAMYQRGAENEPRPPVLEQDESYARRNAIRRERHRHRVFTFQRPVSQRAESQA